MDCLQAIESRRSVRKFKEQEVSDEILMKILNAGRLAPTGGNMQPWEFIVVREKEAIEKIVETTYIGFKKESSNRQNWIKTAPVLIVVCCDYKRTVARYGEAGKKIAFVDTAAAIENMILSAVALGLGSCWVCGYDEKELSKLLSIPESVELAAVLPLGYPESVPSSPNKFSLEEIIHYGEYGNMDF